MTYSKSSINFFWSYHSPTRGVFDFESPGKDLQRLFDTAKEAGLWVITRAGPYCNVRPPLRASLHRMLLTVGWRKGRNQRRRPRALGLRRQPGKAPDGRRDVSPGLAAVDFGRGEDHCQEPDHKRRGECRPRLSYCAALTALSSL